MTTAPSTASGFSPDARLLFDPHGGPAGRHVEFFPEPTADELDGLARLAGLHRGSADASVEVRRTTLRLVRALRIVFGPEVEADRGRYASLLRGIGALETLRSNDPALSRFTPFRMELWTAAAELAGGGTADRAAYRKVLDHSAQKLKQQPDAKFSENIGIPHLQNAVNQLTKLGEGLVRNVLGKPAGPVTRAEVTRVLWAMAGTARRMGALDPAATEGLGRPVLHLPPTEPWTPQRKQELWILTAHALTLHVDADDRFALSALHLAGKGAFGPAHVLREGGAVRGYNWSGAVAPGGLDLRTVSRESADSGGTVSVPAAWTAEGEPAEVLSVWTAADPKGMVVLRLADMPPMRVHDQELLALLDLAPLLRATPLGVPLLFLSSRAGAADRHSPLPQVFTDRTGRNSWAYSGPLGVETPPDGAPLRLIERIDPATGAPGSWNKAWLRKGQATGVPFTSMAMVSSPPAGAVAAADPLFAPQTLLTDDSGAVRGRNWTGEQITKLRADRTLVVENWPGPPGFREMDQDAPWGPETFVVGAEEVPGGGVRTYDGQVLSRAEFARKLAADPALSALPAHV
ncbi:hypothetical protein, partial [Streptomyces zingiberis]